jgi:hypothetical protein
MSRTSHSPHEIIDLRKRVEDLERIVKRFTASNDKVKQSPFFKSTSVSEPVGMDIISKLTLDNESVHSSVIDSPIQVKEVFHSLINENKRDRQVTLNGMTFTVRQFGSDVVYCEEMTGRAFLDPQDAFNNPAKKYIGYWNDRDETVSVRSEAFTEEDEQPIHHEVEKVKVEEVKVKVEEVKVKVEEVKVKVKVEPPKVEEEEEEEQEEEEEEQEEEEDEQELEEITYKGHTYYKDSDNYVYEVNDDGEVDTEKPIGIWIEEKQKVAKYKA